MQYGLIGGRLTHSYSKEIHEAIADYNYELKELAKDELAGFFAFKDFKAVNVTIPYKQDVIPYLDCVSDSAKEIGAVNTIVNKDGRLYGYNTDYAGMIALAEKAGIDFGGAKVLILGTGGTSKTASSAARSMGAKEVIKVSRHADPAKGTVSYGDAQTLHSDADIIINTTPLGMYPDVDSKAIDLGPFCKLRGLLDAVYNPLRSQLVLDAQEKGIPAAGGLYMLAAQAVYACEKFLDRKLGREYIDKAYSRVLSEKQNIVLCGMPSCGKSTIGKMLAEKTGREFTDTDEIIVSKIKVPIAAYFTVYGEESFRNIESETIKELSLMNGLVIATGGGAVLRKENVRDLKLNGKLVFIDRNLGLLTATCDRPLALDRAALTRLYSERYDIYNSCCDVRIENNDSISEVIRKIQELLK